MHKTIHALGALKEAARTACAAAVPALLLLVRATAAHAPGDPAADWWLPSGRFGKPLTILLAT